MKRLLTFASLVGLVVVIGPPAPAATTPTSGSITIRHQTRGCHTWSLNGGPYRPMLETRLGRGGWLLLRNNDPMVHKLIQTSGRPVTMQHAPDGHMKRMGLKHISGHGVMNHMGAAVRVTFTRAGVYRFTTEDLGDYFELSTTGEHHHLQLVVRVS